MAECSISILIIWSKWTRDFNIRPVPVNLIDEKVGNSLEFTGTGTDFLKRTLIVQAVGSTVSKWDLIKLKTTS